MSTNTPNALDVVITGVGAVTAAGVGRAAQWAKVFDGTPVSGADELSLAAFRPAPYLSDKRMLKAVSTPDALGLVGIEELKKNLGWETVKVSPERIGMFVGAPSSPAASNEFYVPAMEAARDGNGKCSQRVFGATCMESKPTALLIGLPNNVLCYGAMILDARGPNNNYTSASTSGLIAVATAARRVARDQLDLAVAGGFAMPSEDQVTRAVQENAGLGTRVASGAVFLGLERREGADARGAKALGRIMGSAQGSDGLGPWQRDPHGRGMESAIMRALSEAGLGLDDIGLVLASQHGVRDVDVAELLVLSRVFAKARARPALGAFSRAFGNLMEAGGMLELASASALLERPTLPAAIQMAPNVAHQWNGKIDASKPHALIVKTGFSGESVALVVGKE